MTNYKDPMHNEYVDVEFVVNDALDILQSLSNELYRTNENHPVVENLREAIRSLETADIHSYYERLESQRGDAWWDEVGE